MNRYITYCTEEQTKKALELGASIEIEDTRDRYSFLPQYSDSMGCRTKKFEDAYKNCYCDETAAYLIPTAEQMIGWLEENKLIIHIECSEFYGWLYRIKRVTFYQKSGDYYLTTFNCAYNFSSRKEAALKAIDEALNYLTKTKEE